MKTRTMKKSAIRTVAAFVAGAGLVAWALTTNDNSAQDAADYAAKTCPAVQR